MKYVIIDSSQLNQVNYNQVEQNIGSCRLSEDGSKAILSYYGDIPNCLTSLNISNEYTHSEILEIVKGEEWNPILNTEE